MNFTNQLSERHFNRLFKFLLKLILCSQCFSSTDASARTGNDLMALCKDVRTVDINLIACEYYIDGAVDAYIVADISEDIDLDSLKITNKNGVALKRRDTFCRPSNVSAVQLTKIVIKYMNDHPAETNNDAALLIMTAIAAAFPCGSSGRSAS